MIGNSDGGGNNKKVNSESQELPVDKIHSKLWPVNITSKIKILKHSNDHVSEELSHLLLNPKW
jgi:hypothetical protein